MINFKLDIFSRNPGVQTSFQKNTVNCYREPLPSTSSVNLFTVNLTTVNLSTVNLATVNLSTVNHSTVNLSTVNTSTMKIHREPVL